MTSNRSISTAVPTILFIFAMFFQSCEEKETRIGLEEQQEIEEYSTVADNTIDEELQAIDETESVPNEGGRLAADPCVTVTRDTIAKQITLDFGTGCVGRYGRERSGRVIVTYGGVFGDGEANRVITFDNYFVNNKQIQGTIELRNFNRNAEGQLTAERKVTGYTVTFPDGNNFVLNGSTTRVWIEGEGDGIRGNEVVQVTGSYEGVSTRNRTFTRTITEPIIADFGCRMSGGFLRVAGTEEMTITNAVGNRTRVVSYGSGVCDNEITVTRNGVSRTIIIND